MNKYYNDKYNTLYKSQISYNIFLSFFRENEFLMEFIVLDILIFTKRALLFI